MSKRITDREAMDDIANLLGQAHQWDDPADYLEDIANTVAQTGRAHPGNNIDPDSYDGSRTDTEDEALVTVARAFAGIWGNEDLAVDMATGLSCGEANALVDLLRAAAGDEVANVWADAHAEGDADETDEHHDRYLEIQRNGDDL